MGHAPDQRQLVMALDHLAADYAVRHPDRLHLLGARVAALAAVQGQERGGAQHVVVLPRWRRRERSDGPGTVQLHLPTQLRAGDGK